MFYLLNRKDDRVVSGHPTTNGYYVNGMRVISVPSDVAIDETNRSGLNDTFTLDDLLEEKYQGIRKNHPLFENMTFDAFSDDSRILKSGGAPLNVGYGSGILWLDPGGVLVTTATVAPAPVDKALPQWDVYSLDREIEGTSSAVKYVAEDPNILDVFLTNDPTDPDWGTTNAVTNEQIFGFPESDINLMMAFHNNTGRRLYLGGFCILY